MSLGNLLFVELGLHALGRDRERRLGAVDRVDLGDEDHEDAHMRVEHAFWVEVALSHLVSELLRHEPLPRQPVGHVHLDLAHGNTPMTGDMQDP